MWTWHKHTLSRQFLAYCSENEGRKNWIPGLKRAWELLVLQRTKMQMPVQWRSWSLPEEQRVEEKEKLPTMCWLAPGESSAISSCFIISHFCAKCAINMLVELPLHSQSCYRVLMFGPLLVLWLRSSLVRPWLAPGALPMLTTSGTKLQTCLISPKSTYCLCVKGIGAIALI